MTWMTWMTWMRTFTETSAETIQERLTTTILDWSDIHLPPLLLKEKVTKTQTTKKDMKVQTNTKENQAARPGVRRLLEFYENLQAPQVSR